MPFVNIQTNVLQKDISDDFIKSISAAVAKLTGKPEDYVAVKVSGDERLFFGGTNAPAAIIDFASIGLKLNETRKISAELMTLIEESLKISSQRIYIRFFDPPGNMFGWNKSTF